MRKTKITYVGGVDGAHRRLVYAAKKNMVTPFTADEAAAYLDFLADRKSRILFLRRKFEKMVMDCIPSAEVNYDKPEGFESIRNMVDSLESAKRGGYFVYKPEDAKALLDYVSEMNEHEDHLYDMIRGETI